MAPGIGIKAPVPRTRTGCLTCRKRKVKCCETKPICSRCQRLQRECTWSDELQIVPHNKRHASSHSSSASPSSIHLTHLSGQNFVMEFPNIDRPTLQYIHHFITFSSRFLCYSNDNESNPFQEELFPQANSSPALLHSMAAVAAGHLSRTQPHQEIVAANYYAAALRELNATLSDPVVAKLDSTLGACLLLCVYEISHSESCLWLDHLQGARDLILFRGGPSTDQYLTRFFSFLDISGSLSSGGGPLLQGNYWIEDGDPTNRLPRRSQRWPYYDEGDIMVSHFHMLMTHMAKLSRLSAESMSDMGLLHPEYIQEKGAQVHDELISWWSKCPPQIRDQRTDWRRQYRPRKLTVAETLEEEAFSSTKSCMQGCIIYLNHVLDPLGQKPQPQEVKDAIDEILEIAKETPGGYGLEMGLYWGLFMAGIAIFNDEAAEDLIRQKLKADKSISIYHADRPLDLLEVLWKRQHQYGTKYDWRQVQIQMGIQIFILA